MFLFSLSWVFPELTISIKDGKQRKGQSEARVSRANPPGGQAGHFCLGAALLSCGGCPGLSSLDTCSTPPPMVTNDVSSHTLGSPPVPWDG
jgi:hypothetical protein